MRAVGAYIYIRGEFHHAAERLKAAIAEAYDAGLMGENAAYGWRLRRATPHHGAGAYICGEETALIESLEGKKGQAAPEAAVPGRVGAYGAADHGQQRRDRSPSSPTILSQRRELVRRLRPAR